MSVGVVASAGVARSRAKLRKKLLAPLGVTETRMMGRPESSKPEPWQICGITGAQRPMELGWKDWSRAKKPSEKRFQP